MKNNMGDNRKFDIYDMQDSYDSGYLDALKWTQEHLYGDNYQLQIRDKIESYKKGE